MSSSWVKAADAVENPRSMPATHRPEHPAHASTVFCGVPPWPGRQQPAVSAAGAAAPSSTVHMMSERLNKVV